MKKCSFKSIIEIIILALLVFVLLKYVSIPVSIFNTTLSIYACAVSVFAVIFGPIVGFVGGFLGNLLVDLTSEWGIWYSWIVATGLYGLLVGIGTKEIDIKNNNFGKKELIKYCSIVVIASSLCWFIVAPIGDVVFYKEPFINVFSQGLFIGISAIVSSIVIGSIILKIYSLAIKTNNKNTEN